MKIVVDSPDMKRDAVFSPCRNYRYVLGRAWPVGERKCVFVMLNPSTADEREDDPTIRRVIGYAQTWGYGACDIVNIFAYRLTDPADLRKVDDPVGPDNNRWILEIARTAHQVVCAWGAHGELHGRGFYVATMLRSYGIPLFTLSVTKHGHPGHPLYLKADMAPAEWEGY